MEKDTTSFWAEIKKFEDALARDPGSFCFAPLAELYRRMGLVDDAIVTAQKGVELHPDYVGGHLALGRAFADKGMKVEARQSLERVIRFTPENLLAQKVLSQIYLETGENDLARKAFEVLLEANPNDSECRLNLESLDRMPVVDIPLELEDDTGSAADLWPSDADEYLLELHPEDSLDDLAEPEIVEENDEPEGDRLLLQESVAPFATAFGECDEDMDEEEEVATSSGIRTATVAELYLSQGHTDQAIAIYRELVAADPFNEMYRARIATLEGSLEPSEIGNGDQSTTVFPDISEDKDFPTEPHAAAFLETLPKGGEELSGNDPEIARLEGWIDNIRRVRGCRSGIS